MKAVGIKVLKAKLSEYVRLAKNGETILVTERDEVVAELRPAAHGRPTLGALDEYLQELADRGEATLASEPAEGWAGIRAVVRLAPGTSQRLIDELRRDGL
jgi:antitoxin (DNA-binding transcriptional repressor) of toxin-antitoxin stability system